MMILGIRIHRVVLEQSADNFHMAFQTRRHERCCTSVVWKVHINLVVLEQLADDFYMAVSTRNAKG